MIVQLLHLLSFLGPYFGLLALIITSGVFVRHSYLINALKLANDNVSAYSHALDLAKASNESLSLQVSALKDQLTDLSKKIDEYQQVIADQAVIIKHGSVTTSIVATNTVTTP
jgi:transcriptional regulatory protein LevR